MEFNRFKMFRLGFMLRATCSLACIFFFFFFLVTWVIFTDISQSSANKPAPSLKACLKSSYPVFEKKRSFLEVRSDVFKSRFPHDLPPPPPDKHKHTLFMCVIHESADVTALMIITMALFIYLQRWGKNEGGRGVEWVQCRPLPRAEREPGREREHGRWRVGERGE